MVDVLVMNFTYFEPSDLALLHSQERVSEKVESLFVSYYESIGHFALLRYVHQLSIIESSLMPVVNRISSLSGLP